MTAAEAKRDAKRMEGDTVTVGVAAGVKIYKGTMVGYDSLGYLNPKDASGNVYAGVSAESATGGDSSGNVTCKVWRKGAFEFNLTSAAITHLGDELYVTDDQTLTTSNANSAHKAGRACIYETANKIFIDIGGYC